MEDRQIIKLLQKRPSAGIHEAMAKYRSGVQAVTAGILRGNAQDIEECIADTFINIWKTADRLDPDTQTFKGLILSTARNVAITRYNQLRRRQVVSIDTFLEIIGEEDVSVTVLGEETSRELQGLIVDMGQPDQEIFFRKYFLFDSIKEIAARLRVDEIQVKNRLYRGRKKLKQQLEERGMSYEAI